MKISNLFFFLIVTLSVSYTQNWRWIAPYPQGNTLFSVCTADNYLYFCGQRKTVVSSTDLGQTFNYLPQYTNQVYWEVGDAANQNIAFVDSINGYLLDLYADEYKTTNGGLTWIKFATGAGNTIINFYDRNKGWKFGNGSYGYTTNGGKTWTTSTPSPLFNKGLVSKTFALDSQVWLLKNYWNDSGGQIFSSTIPGVWNEQITGISSNKNNQLNLSDIKVTPSGYGIAVDYLNYYVSEYQYRYKGVILKTTDFGSNWTNDTTTYDYQSFSAVFTKSDSEWVILGTINTDSYSAPNVISLKSNDFGNSWNSKIISSQYSNYKVSSAVYLKDKNKIIFTCWNDIYASNDFGNSIVKLNKDVPIPTDFVLDKTNKTSSQLGFAIQYFSNRVLVSTNGGLNWDEKILPFQAGWSYQILDIAAADGCLYLLYGYDCYKSSDKGTTWGKIYIPPDYSSYKFSVLDSLHMILLSANGYGKNCIHYTDNGGKNWTNSPVPYQYSFSDIKLFAPGKIIGCGTVYGSIYSGFIYQSSDNGLDWRITSFPQPPVCVNNFSDTSFIAAGNNIAFKSGNKGYLWYTAVPDIDMYLQGNFGMSDNYSAYFKTGYYFTRYVATTDSWVPIYSDPPQWGSASKIDFNYKNNMLVLGDNGLLINTNKNMYEAPGNSAPEMADHYVLFQNYPNPFNPSTKIKFSIPLGESVKNVTIKLYDILGKEVAVILNENKSPGQYEIDFNAVQYKLSSGVYIYQLKRDNNSISRKMVYLK